MPRLSWTAVITGALVALGINFLFDLLSLAIGMSIFSAIEGEIAHLSYYGLIGFLLVGIVAMFTGGWVAGRLSPMPQAQKWGILYGFVAWCLCLVMTTIILTNMLQFAALHANFTSQPDIAAIRIANNKPMQTEAAPAKPVSIPTEYNASKIPKVITLNAFITFLLFFTGAFSSCIGGYLGLGRKKVAHHS